MTDKETERNKRESEGWLKDIVRNGITDIIQNLNRFKPITPSKEWDSVKALYEDAKKDLARFSNRYI